TPDGEPVAVKVIREDLVERSEARGRFDREALAIGMVQGPRVANLVTTSRPDENRQWFAVEYVRGLTLSEYMTEYGPLRLSWARLSASVSPRRSPPSIRRAYCIATSSRLTSSSGRTARR